MRMPAGRPRAAIRDTVALALRAACLVVERQLERLDDATSLGGEHSVVTIFNSEAVKGAAPSRTAPRAVHA